MDLICAVIALAENPGYVLIGQDEQVWRRRIRRGEEVERVVHDEATAVHQLLDQKLLTRGAPLWVHDEGYTERIRSVLVPKSTHNRLRRWKAYRRPANWGQPRHAQLGKVPAGEVRRLKTALTNRARKL